MKIEEGPGCANIFFLVFFFKKRISVDGSEDFFSSGLQGLEKWFLITENFLKKDGGVGRG